MVQEHAWQRICGSSINFHKEITIDIRRYKRSPPLKLISNLVVNQKVICNHVALLNDYKLFLYNHSCIQMANYFFDVLPTDLQHHIKKININKEIEIFRFETLYLNLYVWHAIQPLWLRQSMYVSPIFSCIINPKPSSHHDKMSTIPRYFIQTIRNFTSLSLKNKKLILKSNGIKGYSNKSHHQLIKMYMNL